MAPSRPMSPGGECVGLLVEFCVVGVTVLGTDR